MLARKVRKKTLVINIVEASFQNYKLQRCYQLTSPSARQQGRPNFQDLVRVIPFLDGMIGTASDKLELTDVAEHVVVGSEFVLLDVNLALLPRSKSPRALR